MFYELLPANPTVKPETISQAAWPAIWRWLCERWEAMGAILPVVYWKDGQLNKGHVCTDHDAQLFARIIEEAMANDDVLEELRVTAPTLTGGTRAQRLVMFFRACGGFEIW